MKQKRQAERVIHNVQDLLTDLKTCGIKRDLQWGRRIHAKAVESQNGSNMYVTTALINMYGKCGSMVDARRVFDGIQKQSTVSWTALLLGYAANGEGFAALDLFSKMKTIHGCTPDSVTYIAALKACTSLAVNGGDSGKADCLERGKKIHTEIGRHLDPYVQSTLIDMYSKCGSMVEARRVFGTIQKPNVVSWTALIMGYTENGEGNIALDLFAKMKAEGVCAPNTVTYVAAFKACTCLAAKGDNASKKECLKRGKEIHSEVGSKLDHYMLNTLIDMYANCRSMPDAHRVFDSVQKPDVVSWNALIMGYAENGEGKTALDLFSRMKTRGCPPNSVTYLAALKACTSLAAKEDGISKVDCLERGRELHSEIGRHMDHYVQSTLVDMYAKCGSMEDARQMFESIRTPNVVSWSALIIGYAENGEGHTALDLFSRMKCAGCAPNSVTFIAALKACTSLATNGNDSEKEDCLKQGREIHSEIGRHLNHYMRNTLIDMYANCGSMVDARRVFDSIQKPDVVSWTALILGYAQNGEGHYALDLFSRMKSEHECAPDSVSYIAALKTCSLIGALALGRTLHSDISEFTSHVVTCVVDFYAKCGSITEARKVFDFHSNARAVSTWNALLAGYGSFGDTSSVFKFFEAMQDQGFKPDAVTFVCMLSCCSHAGLIEKAREYFEAMPVQYGVTPSVMHYTCMVDVLGRANQMDEAITVMRKMPYNPNAVTWMTLLGACRKWKNVEIGSWAFQSLVNMDKNNAPAYILMAHIYGSRGMWEEQEKVLETIGTIKRPEQTYVTNEAGKMVRFVVGERDSTEVKQKLKELFQGMKEQGYADSATSHSAAVLEKEESLCGHTERRAVAYGLLNTPSDESIRAFKNMRMCDDCHWSIKLFSKISERVIMVRDESRFHLMENGSCSCRDYW